MTDRSSRDTEYVVVRDRKPKKPIRYYYDNDNDDDDDDDDDNEIPITSTRRIVRTKPIKEQRIKYITTDELESDHRRQQISELNDRKIKVRNTTDGEQVLLDEDNNLIKIIRNSRTPTPPLIESRRIKIRPREPQTVYYETPDGHIVARPPKNHSLRKSNKDFVYAEDEPTKVVRKVIVDPKTGNQETIYEKDKPKKQPRQKYVIRKRSTEIAEDSDDEDEPQQQPQYVQVVQRRTVPTQVVKQEAATKYVMIRKKVDSEPVYAVAPSIPATQNNRRIVYQAPTKNSTTKYVYATDGKYYK